MNAAGQERRRLPLVVLISGSGTNLQAIIDATRAPFPATVAAVVSNRPQAYGLERARRAGIATEIVDRTLYADRASFESALRTAIDEYEPGLVVLAGFMHVLSTEFVQHYTGRMLNIHPSLLPAFCGLHTHRRALAEGVREHGCTVHFVTAELDGGPIVLQARVPVLPADDETTLAARVQVAEHEIYPQAIRWFAEGRLRVENGKAMLDGKPISPAQVQAEPGHP